MLTNCQLFFKKNYFFYFLNLQKLIQKWEETVKLVNLLMIMVSNLIMIKYIINQKIIMICEDYYKENWILLIMEDYFSVFSC